MSGNVEQKPYYDGNGSNNNNDDYNRERCKWYCYRIICCKNLSIGTVNRKRTYYRLIELNYAFNFKHWRMWSLRLIFN